MGTSAQAAYRNPFSPHPCAQQEPGNAGLQGNCLWPLHLPLLQHILSVTLSPSTEVISTSAQGFQASLTLPWNSQWLSMVLSSVLQLPPCFILTDRIGTRALATWRAIDMQTKCEHPMADCACREWFSCS